MIFKMSIFKGSIKELENILIDNFFCDEKHTCFFLSHCHSDHMNGLKELLLSLKDKPDQYLYCSPISRLILLNKFSEVNHKVIKELTSTTVIIVPENDVSPSYKITVTPIPAGHCPGSIMFLFEATNKTVLYTGDFRIIKADISKFKPLHTTNEVKLIHKLYFDSTFLNEIYWNFPLRSEVVLELINITKNWLDKDHNHNILLETSALYGYEFIFVELSRKLKCKIHVKDSIYNLYWNVPEVGCMLTKDCNSTKVHAFCMFDKKCYACKDSKNLLRIRFSAQWYKSTQKNVKKPIWKEVYKQKILVCYSTHCSCSELVDFLNYLHPEEVEACTTAVGCSEEEKNAYIRQLMCTWPLKKKERSPEPVKRSFSLEKNYKFKVKFPSYENDESNEHFFEYLPERKKRLLSDSDVLINKSTE